MDKAYPKSHVMMITGLNVISFLIGVMLVAGPFLKGELPGSFDTTVHAGLGALIATLAIFRAALGYGSIWIDVCLVVLGFLVLMLPTAKFMHMQWNTEYTMVHMVSGGIVMAVAVVSALATIPVIKKMRVA